ncbi:hypothetical protein AGMMS50222_09630 [Endomicrobiia bacterium]|nr:hypothetical protein AGMMS49531_10710 [Endomicrobiia bacterium]GHT67551.1 hypothetical protein AGMMS49556_09190 [Endomicrobiia bacterium]GHT71886.1 hypothetical protein AGMMS49950_09390 [Endomicrobiia bacterium]GHT76699.1 hypothetical protein AGMMS50222_09630 [Endomicrobiia bacterium]
MGIFGPCTGGIGVALSYDIGGGGDAFDAFGDIGDGEGFPVILSRYGL